MAPTLTTTVTPVTGAIGAVVDGVDLHHGLDDATAQLLRDALHEHSVLFFHDQELTEDEQLAFASTFGPVGQYPLTKMFGGTAMSSTIEDTADSPPDADGWHTDVTWVAEPPAYAVLNAQVIPERGRRHDVVEPVRRVRRAVTGDAGPVLPADRAPPLRRRLPRARVAQHGRRGRRADHARVPAGRAPARAHPSRHRSTRAVRVGPVHGPDRRHAPRRERRAPRLSSAATSRTRTSACAGTGPKATSRCGTKRAPTTARCPTTTRPTASCDDAPSTADAPTSDPDQKGSD